MPYLSAQRPHALQVAGRRHEHAVGADDRLEDDRRDRAGALERDDLLEVRERTLGLLLGRVRVERRAVRVRPEEVRDRPVGGLVRPAARVARERDRRGGAAVVAAVHRQHLAPAGHGTGHAHGVLVGVGPAVGEEHLVEVAGRHLGDAPGELAAHVVRHRRLDRREAPRLLLDRRDEVGVLVPEVEVHELRAEVEVRVARVVPERRALARRDGQRVDEGLRAPRVEDVRAVVGAHLRVGGEVGQRMPRAVPVGVRRRVDHGVGHVGVLS